MTQGLLLMRYVMQVAVEMNRDASFKDLRQLLGRWMDADPDHVRVYNVTDVCNMHG